MKPYTIFVDGKEGVWIPLDHSAIQRFKIEGHIPPPGTRVSLAKVKGERVQYPPLFEAFWKAYHPKRRVGKQEALAAYRGLGYKDREILPAAAKNYTDELILAGTFPTHILHPERFILKGRFRDYAEMSDTGEVMKAIQYWETAYHGKTGVPYPWKADERMRAAEDIERMSPPIWRDRVWFFFAGGDHKVKEAQEELGITYGAFRHMLTTVLNYSGMKRKAACKYCGRIDSHAINCPVFVSKMQEKKAEREAVEAGKTEGMAALSDLKGRLKGKLS